MRWRLVSPQALLEQGYAAAHALRLFEDDLNRALASMTAAPEQPTSPLFPPPAETVRCADGGGGSGLEAQLGVMSLTGILWMPCSTWQRPPSMGPLESVARVEPQAVPVTESGPLGRPLREERKPAMRTQ